MYPPSLVPLTMMLKLKRWNDRVHCWLYVHKLALISSFISVLKWNHSTKILGQIQQKKVIKWISKIGVIFFLNGFTMKLKTMKKSINPKTNTTCGRQKNWKMFKNNIKKLNYCKPDCEQWSQKKDKMQNSPKKQVKQKRYYIDKKIEKIKKKPKKFYLLRIIPVTSTWWSRLVLVRSNRRSRKLRTG